MRTELLQQLTKIYNTFNLIHTKGEDTRIMSKCLEAFESLLIDLSKELKEG